MWSSAFGSRFLIHAMSRNTPPCGLPRPALHLAVDAARDVIAGQQLGRPSRRLVSLRVAPALFLVVGGLVAIGLGDVVEHEAAALVVEEDASFAAHAFGHQDPLDARRPDHPGRMELDELHVDQLGAGVIGERVAVAGALPAVARDPVGAARARRSPARRRWRGTP